jgi:hypothetical protein
VNFDLLVNQNRQMKFYYGPRRFLVGNYSSFCAFFVEPAGNNPDVNFYRARSLCKVCERRQFYGLLTESRDVLPVLMSTAESKLA